MLKSEIYSFIFLDDIDNSYVFKTNQYIFYQIKFKPTKYLFGKESSFSKNTFELVIEVIQNPLIKLPETDKLISNTISVIFLDFFKNNNFIILYICETNDLKHNARFRKFDSWFKLFNDGSFVKKDIELIEPHKDITYFNSLILKKDNPYFDEIISEFKEVLNQYSK